MKCKVCEREANTEFCEQHERAYKNLVEKYEVWKRALELSWKEYLSEVARNSYTGKWAREVAEYLLKNGRVLKVE